MGGGGSFSSILFFQILFRDRGLHFLRNEVAHIETQKKKKSLVKVNLEYLKHY